MPHTAGGHAALAALRIAMCADPRASGQPARATAKVHALSTFNNLCAHPTGVLFFFTSGRTTVGLTPNRLEYWLKVADVPSKTEHLSGSIVHVRCKATFE
jgi:hypothetical protein